MRSSSTRASSCKTRSASPISAGNTDPSVTFLLDFSKNLITEPILATLLDLDCEADVETVRDKMFTGKHINTSENRTVLHAADRNFDDFKISEAGVDEVGKVLTHIKELTDSVRSGTWTGYTGKTINNIVNIPLWSLRR